MENITENILQQIAGYEGFPAAASQVISIANDPAASASQMEKTLKFDQTMTANVLRLANSAYYGRSSKVGSLREAVVIVGFGKLAEMVVTAYLKSLSERPLKGYDLSAGDLLNHALTVAVAADEIRKTMGRVPGGNHFTAALLHDIGKMILGQFVGEEISRIEELTATGIAFDAAESKILGINHAEAGGLILEKWKLPVEIVEAVRWHHDPDHAPSDWHFIIDVVHLANTIAMGIGLGAGREGLRHLPSQSALKRLGMEPRQLERIASETLMKAKSLAQAIEEGGRE